MQLLSLSADLGFGLGLRSLDPALALLGTNAEGLAIDGPSLRAVVRSPGLNWSGNMNDLLTYAAPSTKWIVNKAGVLESGTALRCEYDPATGDALGVRIETEQATNLFSRSDDFSNAVWPKGTATVTGGQLAPDGSNGAVMFTGPFSTLFRNVTVASFVGGICFCLYAKSGYNGTWSFLVRNSTTAISLNFVDVNLTTGVVSGGTGVAERAANGFWRISISQPTGISNGDSLALYYSRYAVADSRALTLWGADLYDSPNVSSHISTVTSAVTRAADDITLPLADFPWNGGSGTLKLNGATVSPILNGASDALDIDAIVATASATHLKTLTWVPA